MAELVLCPGWADVLVNDSSSNSNTLEEMSAGGASVIESGVDESHAVRTRPRRLLKYYPVNEARESRPRSRREIAGESVIR